MADNTERDLIAETVRQEIAKIAAEKDGENTQSPTPLTLNIGGQQYTFNDQADLEAKLTQTFSTFREELGKKTQSTPESEKQGAYVSGKEEPFDQVKYIELMGQDPVKAHNYVFDHTFGMPNAAKLIKDNLAEAANLKATVSVYQFRELHPEFPMTPEATQIVDGIRKELNQPFTLQGLEAAYGVAQSRGMIPSPQLLAYQQQLIKDGLIPDPSQRQQQQQRSGYQPIQGPPPSVNRQGTPQQVDLAAQAENMSLEELERALRKAGVSF